MKTSRITRQTLAMGLSLSLLASGAGCLRASSETLTNAGAAEPGSTSAVAVVTSSDTNAAALAAASAPAGTNAPVKDIAEADVKGVVELNSTPAPIASSGTAGELLRMASSGVDEKVLQAYITNSPSPFNLTADEIIYLKDLGISGDVVASALHKDQQFKAAGVSTEVVGAAAAAAPGYGGPTTNWVGQPQQPDPSQVAPQMTAPASGEGQPAPTVAAVPAPAPQVEVSYSNFYSSLAPYGTWVELDGYGRVWQPTVVVVNNSWSPYFDGGRWIYTDAGWYWSSDYSWGWAPFHYGRWFRHYRLGWCWTPDLVWGPSWVTWRYNDAYCGWAPLPPAACYTPGYGFTYYGSSVGFGFGFGLGWSSYTFIGWDHFHHNDHHYRYNHLHAVPSHRAHDVYNNTTVVTRIVGNNNTVINEGISAQRVEAATRTRVERVNLRETRSPDVVRSGRAERLDPAGKTLTVFKPEAPRGQRIGGIPMERVRTTGASPIVARNEVASATPERAGGSRLAGGTRSGSIGTAPATTTTTVRSGAAASEGNVRPITTADVDSRGRIARPARTAPADASSLAAGNTPAKPGTAERIQTRNSGVRNDTAIVAPQVTPQRSAPAPRTETRPSTSVTPSRPAAVERRSGTSSGAPITPPAVTAPAQPRSSAPRVSAPAVSPTAPAPRPTSPAPAPTAPVTRPTPSVQTQTGSQPQGGQRSFWASPRAAQTPSTPAPAPAAAPQRSTYDGGARQPSVNASPRAYQAPSRVDRPNASTYSAPQQREYSAPQRQFSAPQAPQRDFSASQSGSSRQFSAPGSAPRSFSAPPAPSYSAPSGGGGGRSYSAPAPAASSDRPSRSDTGTGMRTRGDR